MTSPQVETANVLTIDFAGNPDLREVFSGKDVGDKVTIRVELQVMSKQPEGVQCAIEKVITEDYGQDGEEKEAVADESEPIMMRMRKKGSNAGGKIPNKGSVEHGRPAETARNSNEPWMTSYT